MGTRERRQPGRVTAGQPTSGSVRLRLCIAYWPLAVRNGTKPRQPVLRSGGGAAPRVKNVSTAMVATSVLSPRHVLAWFAAVIFDEVGPFGITLQIGNLLPSSQCEEADTADRTQCKK